MNTKPTSLTAIACLTLLLLLRTPPTAAQFAFSSFDADDDGWTIADFTDGAPYVSPNFLLASDWNSAGGDPGAYIVKRDPSAGTFFFNAPVKFLGDLSSIVGGTLDFSLRTDRGDYTTDSVVALVGVVSGTPRAIVADIQPQPVTSWTRYSIPLFPSAFRYDNRSGAVVSSNDFRSVFTNVTALRISAEYGGIVIETTALDSVRLLAPCNGEPPTVGIGFYPVISIYGSVGCHYRIEFTTDVDSTNWFSITNLVLPQSPYMLIDTLWTNAQRRFYRAVEIQ